MIRGTTAQFKFQLPCMKNELEWATIKFWQDGYSGPTDAPLPIIKELKHCSDSDDPNELCVSLTSKETLRFSDKFKAKAQLRAKMSNNNTIFASHQQAITVYPIYGDISDDGFIDDTPIVDDGLTILDGGVIVQEAGDNK